MLLDEVSFVELDETGFDELDAGTELELIELESAVEEFGLVCEESRTELEESASDELSAVMSSLKGEESLGFSEQQTRMANIADR